MGASIGNAFGMQLAQGKEFGKKSVAFIGDSTFLHSGITGLASAQYNKGDIIKGNVGTFWQNLVMDTFKVYQPELYRDMYDWTIKNYKPKNPGKADNEIFGKNVKYAIKEYYNRIHSVDEETVKTLEAQAYAEARVFIRSFGSKGKASLVRCN